MNASLPDIVLVVADDLGHRDLSCYGATAFSTPVIDRLAARGRRFTDAHAASAVCTPSRYALLTGRYPWRSPLRSRVLGGTDGALIPAGMPTLPGELQGVGYRTAAIGKWHLGMDWRLRDGNRRCIDPDLPFHPRMEADGWDVDYSEPVENGPTARGFDHFFGIAGSLDMPPYCFLRGDRVETTPTVPKQDLVTSQRPGPSAPGWRDDRADPRFADEASEWLRETAPQDESDPPRFLYLATSAPHRPCVPSAEFAGVTGIGPRADSIVMIDRLLGQVLAALETSARPRIIIFTSDNGAPIGHREDGALEDHLPNGELRGQKADVYDGGHRVPLIISGDGIPPGIEDGLVSHLDLMPSLLREVGVPAAASSAVDGTADLLRAAEAGQSHRVVGASAFDGSMVLMRGGEAAVYSTGSGGFSAPVGSPTAIGGDRGQFYDRSRDPRQREDLWDIARERERTLAADFVSDTGYGATHDQLR